MCNLYTLRLSAWEVRNLMQHYSLIGEEWEKAIGARNDALELYPNYEAPVVVVRDGQRVVETMRWGFPAAAEHRQQGTRHQRAEHGQRLLAAVDRQQGPTLHRPGNGLRGAGPQHQQAGRVPVVSAD